MKEKTLEPVKDLAYWKKNAEEDYLKVPISVLRYITELEERMYSEEDMKQFGLYLGDNLKKLKGKTIDEIFEQFKNL